MKIEMPYVCLYLSNYEIFKPYPYTEIGRVVMNMLHYAIYHEEPADLPGKQKYLWPPQKSQIDRDLRRYADTCEKNRQNAIKGAQKRWNRNVTEDSDRYPPPAIPDAHKPWPATDGYEKEKEKENENENENEKENEKEKERESERYTISPPPTLDEVISFVRDNNLAIDPGKFCSYYSSRGWQTAQNNPVDWRLKAREWHESQLPVHKPAAPGQGPSDSRSTSYDMADIESFNVFTDWKG